jgi:hypothetical protein
MEQKATQEKIQQNDFADIELPDILTGEIITNLQKIVNENKISIDSIYIQSLSFDPSIYLRTVHSGTDLQTFRRALDKLKSQSLSCNNQVKVKLIIENFDSFLEAKKVLDNINHKFADADQTREQLKTLEHTMLVLRQKTDLSLQPLTECLYNIEDCVETMHAVNHISMLLNLNREVQLSLIQEDNVIKAVDTIKHNKQLILNAQQEHAYQRKVHGNDELLPLEKFLVAFEKTILKVVERIGY